MHDFINSPATTTSNFGIRLADWQSELGYNLYTVSGSCGYLLQLTLEALQQLQDCKLFIDGENTGQATEN